VRPHRGSPIAFWKPGAEDVFGYTRDEAVGRSIFDLLAPADRRALQSADGTRI